MAEHEEPDWSPVHAWFRKWFEEKLGGEAGEDGLMGMVHLFSDPIPEGGGYLFTIDFGSAPVAAFFELLQALSDMGASEVRIGHSDGTEMDAEVVETLRSATLTQEQFVKVVCAAGAGAGGGDVGVEVAEEPPGMVLKIKEEGLDDASTSNLGNLWLVLQRTAAEHRPRERALPAGATGIDAIPAAQ